MTISCGQPINDVTLNTAFMSRLSNTDTVGTVDLLNAGSDSIFDLQSVINGLKANNNLFIKTEDNSKVTWQAPNLSFTADIEVHDKINATITSLETSNSPISINDGESVYIVLDRSASSAVGFTKGATIPNEDTTFRLVTRIGDDLWWWDNTVQLNNKSIRVGEGGSGTVGKQEVIGVGNGVATNFTLSFIPNDGESIIVFANHVRQETNDWTFNDVSNQVEFVSAPAAGIDIFVWYLTEGNTLSAPAPTGNLQTEYITLSATDISNGNTTLSNTPAVANSVLVDVIGGGPQHYNVDFTVSGSTLDWNALALDGVLTNNDVLRVNYVS